MSQPCFEIVSYTVGNDTSADLARDKARQLLAAFPGFIAWVAFSGTDDPANRADLVVWQNTADAQMAAQAVGTDPAFADFRASITSVTSMAHYSTNDSAFASRF